MSFNGTRLFGPGLKNDQNALRPVNLSILSLVTVLAQIMLGKAIEALNIPPDLDMNSVISNYKTTKELTRPIIEGGGMSYGIKVQWCLDSALSIAGLEDEDFCQNFYTTVVGRIEKNVSLVRQSSGRRPFGDASERYIKGSTILI